MENTPQLYDTLVHVLSQPTPWLDQRHLKSLAWMMVGLIHLLYLSTSFLWRQAVAAIIEVTSSNPLRMNSRCTRRPRELAEYAQHRHPPCAQPVALLREGHGGRPRLPPRRGTAQASHREQGHPGGRTWEEK